LSQIATFGTRVCIALTFRPNGSCAHLSYDKNHVGFAAILPTSLVKGTDTLPEDTRAFLKSTAPFLKAETPLLKAPLWRSTTRRWILLTYARQFLLWAYFTYLLWCLLSLLTSRVMARFHQKVPVLHVCLVVMAGNCFWCILEEMFLVVWRVYNGRLCGRSFSWTSGEFVAVRRVGVLLLVRFAKPNLCVWGGHI